MAKRKWTTADIPSLNGKVALVTGANSGLGYETTKALTGAGATVIMACRNVEKGEAAMKRMEKDLAWSDLTVLQLDLASLESIRSFSELVMDREEKIDILVNNAGLMALPYRQTVDGFEMQFGVNHLGHFALTGLLFPMLNEGEEARIVNVSSMAHRFGTMNFSDLQSIEHYKKWKAYGQSKLANLLFTCELNKRIKVHGGNVIALSAHPGYAATELVFKGPELENNKSLQRILNLGNRIVGQPAWMGALPSLFAATAPEAEQGAYYGPGGLLGIRGYPVKSRPKAGLVNDADARRLWEESMKLTSVYWLEDKDRA